MSSCLSRADRIVAHSLICLSVCLGMYPVPAPAIASHLVLAGRLISQIFRRSPAASFSSFACGWLSSKVCLMSHALPARSQLLILFKTYFKTNLLTAANP